MTAQPQLVQGCTICGVPSDPESEMRETAAGGRLGGVAFLLVTFLWPRKEKSLAQARRAGEIPSRAEPSRSMRHSRIRGLTAGSGIRRESVVVEQTISCGAMRCAYCTLRVPRTSEYATLFEPTASHHIVNLRGTLTPLTIALSQGGRGQRRRERQQAGKRKGAGQAPFDALIG